MCIDALKCVAQLAVKRLIYAHTWNLLMQSMVLQILVSNYHAHLKQFGVPNGIVFGVKNCANFYFSNMYLILQWDPYLLSYSNLKWSRDFLEHPVYFGVLYSKFASKLQFMSNHLLLS